MTGLVFGSLDLMGGGAIQLEALGTDSGTDWGNPGPIETQLNSFLQYGALVASEGYENRTVMVAVSVQGTGPVRAAAEAVLAGEIRKRNVLLYTPPYSTVATRFEVLTSSFDQVPNDLLEVANGERIYMLRLVCLPFAFSSGETTTSPFTPPTSVTTTVVDDGSSTSGWRTFDNPPPVIETLSSSGGVLTGTYTFDGSDLFQYLATVPKSFTAGILRTGNFSLSGTPYIAVDQRVETDQPTWYFRDVRIVVNGVEQTIISATTLGNGFTRYWVQPNVTTVNEIGVLATIYNSSNSYQVTQGARVNVDQVFRSNSYTAVSTNKQLQRTLTIAGSAPTSGSIAIEHPTTALGDVLLYTSTAVYSPALRSLRTSGPSTPTVDASTVSGAYDTISGSQTVVYSTPYASIPQGEYLVMARVQTAGATIAVTAATVSGSTVVGTNQVARTFGVLNQWTFVRLGMMPLPLMSAGNGTALRFTVGQAGGNSVLIDEVYLFNLRTGRLTQVACGTSTPSAGGSSNRLWVDSPSIDNNGLGDMLRGFGPGRTDAFSAFPYSESPGIHEFAPPSVMAFTVTTGADSAAISFRHRPSWFHTAAS